VITERVMPGHAAVDDGAAMTDTTSTDTRSNGDVSTYNVIAVTFEDDVNAYAALTKLKELASQGQLEVQEAAVVKREADGSVTVKDRVGSDELMGTASGDLVGLLVGVIGGPLGMLLGDSYGLLVGSLFDLDEEERTETTLGEISKSVQAERAAVLAVVSEPSPEVIDAAMATLGGTVLRRSVYDVEAEVAPSSRRSARPPGRLGWRCCVRSGITRRRPRTPRSRSSRRRSIAPTPRRRARDVPAASGLAGGQLGRRQRRRDRAVALAVDNELDVASPSPRRSRRTGRPAPASARRRRPWSRRGACSRHPSSASSAWGGAAELTVRLGWPVVLHTSSLRNKILLGDLPPGTTFSQVQLSSQLG
jgi:uncharacterized membrane protein